MCQVESNQAQRKSAQQNGAYSYLRFSCHVSLDDFTCATLHNANNQRKSDLAHEMRPSFSRSACYSYSLRGIALWPGAPARVPQRLLISHETLFPSFWPAMRLSRSTCSFRNG